MIHLFRRSFNVLLCSAALGLFASPGAAYLAQNSAFDSDLSGWVQQAGNWNHRPDDGIFGLGSAETVSEGAGSSSINQCVDLSKVPAGYGLYALGFGRTIDHSNAVLLSLELFTTGDCSGAVANIQQDQSFPQQNQWSYLYVVGTVPSTPARSARVWATAFSSTAGQTTRIDVLGLTHNSHFNPDLSDDLTSWIQNEGSWSHVSDDGYGAADGAAEVMVTNPDCGAGNACAFMSQCLSLNATPRSSLYFTGAAFKGLDEVDDLIVSYFFYPENDCSGSTLVQTNLGATLTQVGVWQRFTTNFEVPASARSVAIFVGLNDGELADRFRFDSFYFVPPSNLVVLLDGFETGNTSGWSTTVD